MLSLSLSLSPLQAHGRSATREGCRSPAHPRQDGLLGRTIDMSNSFTVITITTITINTISHQFTTMITTTITTITTMITTTITITITIATTITTITITS